MKYWSSPIELVARAFEAWVEDQLKLSNRRSDYLVCGTKDAQAFPADDERKRINVKMEELIRNVFKYVLD